MKQKAQQYCSFLCRLPIERCTCQAQYHLRDVGKAPGGNLYDLYRSMRALRTKLMNLEQHPDIQRDLLNSRALADEIRRTIATVEREIRATTRDILEYYADF